MLFSAMNFSMKVLVTIFMLAKFHEVVIPGPTHRVRRNNLTAVS